MEETFWEYKMSKLITDVDKKIEKAFFEVKSLKIEYSLIKSENQENLREFREAVVEYAKENNLPIDNVFSVEPSDEDISRSALKVDLSSNLKKLYKKIAMKTHPDKVKNLPDEFREMMMKYHSELSEGLSLNCPSVIIDIAQKLNMKDINLGVEEYLTLEGEKEELSEKISGIKKTYAWIWAKSNKSDKLIKMFLGVKDE